MRCPDCGRDNTGNTGFCISCGANIPGEEKPGGPDPEPAREEENGGASSPPAPPTVKRAGTGWKVAVVLLAIAVLALAGTTAYFATANREKETRVEELSTTNENLSRKVNALPYVLEGLEAVSRQTVNVIEKYYPGDAKESGEWQDYVTDSLVTIEKLSSIYREYLEGGKLENTGFLETVEKILNEFLDSDNEKKPKD